MALRKPGIFILGLVLVGLFCSLCLGQSKNANAEHSAGSNAAIERGKYIVEDVAICSQCHTPRDGQGRLDRSKWLEGAPLWLNPAQPTADWPLQAPRIAGDPPEPTRK